MAAFKEITEARRLLDSSLFQLPGVQAIATGYKRVKGRTTDELAIIVYVAKKAPLDRLPLFHTMPSVYRIRGIDIPTDVIEVGYYVPYAYTSRERPALGGISIAHLDVTAGTLGGLVCDKETSETLIISNNHILAASNGGSPGDHIVQPGPYDGGTCHGDCIATLKRYVPIKFDGSTNYVDCAVAKPYRDEDVSFEIHDIGTPSSLSTYPLTLRDVQKRTHVQKTGKKTEHTEGYVEAVDWVGNVGYPSVGIARFARQIVVQSLNGVVSLGGDSGSLVLTMDKPARICGLLFAGPISGQHYIANHIEQVFSRLNVNLCCAPTKAAKKTKTEEFLPDLRKFREQFRTQRGAEKYFDLYDRNSGKFLEALARNPELGESARAIIEDIGKAIRNPQQKIDQKSVELGLKLIDTISKMRESDKEFLKDMEKVKDILKKSGGRTIAQILRMLRE